MTSHARNVTWTELFSSSPKIDYDKILAQWASRIVVDYEIAPVGMSAFGSIFFMKRDKTVQCLNPIRGDLRQVAKDYDEFGKHMNTVSWQIENLHSMVVAQVVAMGLERPAEQVYALAPHPNFTSGMSLERSKVMVMDAVVWHSISAQSF
ncbi:MAG TPA: hypothetical protein VJM31_15095 [Vicinamibacterales bacterium]|nr:hypothetical protein [Vicinamibacterales bacterium]